MKTVKYSKFDITDFEKFVKESGNENYLLKLYVSGNTPQSFSAIENIKKICEENLNGRYTLEVIDLYQNPDLAQEANIIAVPTLVKHLPLPLRRIIGDLSDHQKVLIGLNLEKY